MCAQFCVCVCFLYDGDGEEDYFVHSRCTRDNFWYYIILGQESSQFKVNYDRLLYSVIQHLYDRHIYIYIYIYIYICR